LFDCIHFKSIPKSCDFEDVFEKGCVGEADSFGMESKDFFMHHTKAMPFEKRGDAFEGGFGMVFNWAFLEIL
jgi:hypothetical protein